MGRDYLINGETMVSVKGRADSAIGSLTLLGLSSDPIRVRPNFVHKDITLDAWGGQVPAEIQYMLASVDISISLIHFDRTVLDVCLMESMAGSTTIGSMRRAGSRMGNGLPRFAAGGVLGNHFIGLNLASPVGNKPWRFFYTYMTGPPIDHPLGTEKSIVATNWRAVPYSVDPWGGGTGAEGVTLWDYSSDT